VMSPAADAARPRWPARDDAAPWCSKAHRVQPHRAGQVQSWQRTSATPSSL
jgi:hypothetical protein